MIIDPEVRKDFTEHRQHLIEGRRLSFEQSDKAIFLLSGGGLTISLTLIENIIPFATALNKIFLEISWAIFTLSIISTLISFILSQKALDTEIQKVDSFLSSGDEDALTGKNYASTWTRNLNIISLICFLIAVAALISFVYLNIS